MLFYKEPFSRKLFVIINYFFLGMIALLCIFPMIHVLAVSLSSNAQVSAGAVIAWPREFQLDTYKFVVGNPQFYTAFGISVERTLLGIIVNMLLTVLAAYPLSLSRRKFKERGFYVWFFLITILFSGGLIPGFLIVKYTGLLDSIWALIIPGAVPVFNVILLQNFFKELPVEISESAHIDGMGHWTILFRIMIPLAKPAIATLVLFVAVFHWNSWFDGILYMNRAEHYPLQSYLQTIVVQVDIRTATNLKSIKNISQQNSKAAQIIVAMLPILVVYPFLQKHFTKGIVLGSVKG